MSEKHGMTAGEFMMILVGLGGGGAIAMGDYLWAGLAAGAWVLLAWMEISS